MLACASAVCKRRLANGSINLQRSTKCECKVFACLTLKCSSFVETLLTKVAKSSFLNNSLRMKLFFVRWWSVKTALFFLYSQTHLHANLILCCHISSTYSIHLYTSSIPRLGVGYMTRLHQKSHWNPSHTNGEEQQQSTEAHSMEISKRKIWIKFAFSLCDFVHSTWTSVRARTASWRCRVAAADVTYLSSRFNF